MPTPLLLVHGALGSASQLAPLAEAFRPSRPVFVLELEGHGETPATAPAYSVERFAENIRGFIAACGIQRPAVFGYSMGGYVALQLAGSSPGLLGAVITLGTKVAWTPEVAARETNRLDPATIRAKVPKFADVLERRHAGAGGWESVLTKTAAIMTDLGAHPRVGPATFERIDTPTRLMVGDRDNVVTVDETAAAARAIRDSELCVLPGTPHPIEQVRVGLVTSLLADFFSTRSLD